MGVRDGSLRWLFSSRGLQSGRYGRRDREAGLRWHTNPIITKHLEEVKSTPSDRAVGRWRLGNCRIGRVGLCHRDSVLLNRRYWD